MGTGAAASLAQICAQKQPKEDSRRANAVTEEYHFRGISKHIVSSFCMVSIPSSVGGKLLLYAASVMGEATPPLLGNDLMTAWGPSIHVYPIGWSFEIPSLDIKVPLHLHTLGHLLVNFSDFDVWSFTMRNARAKMQKMKKNRRVLKQNKNKIRRKRKILNRERKGADHRTRRITDVPEEAIGTSTHST